MALGLLSEGSELGIYSPFLRLKSRIPIILPMSIKNIPAYIRPPVNIIAPAKNKVVHHIVNLIEKSLFIFLYLLLRNKILIHYFVLNDKL